LKETDRTDEEEVYRRAIELDPEYALGHFNLACLFARTGQKTESLASLKRAIELDAESREMAKTQPAFDAIREDPEFMKLIEGGEE